MLRTSAKIALAAVPYLVAPVTAQQRPEIQVHFSGLQAPAAVNACGFDCGNPSNTVQVAYGLGQAATFILGGDLGSASVLIVGVGSALGACPGPVLPGIGNSLQMGAFAAAIPARPMARIGRPACNNTGTTFALSNLRFRPSAVGVTLTWQGVVFAGGQPAFTRPVQMALQ